MKLLVDTDAFCKLGVASLLKDAVGLLGAELRECGRLAALPYMLRRGKLQKQFGAEACERLVPIAEEMPLIPQASDVWLEQLTQVQGIDPGEAQMLASAAETGLVVVSGDKRALRALKCIESFVNALDGRIVVLDALLIALCDHLGTEQVRSRIPAMAAADKTLKVCFSAGNDDPRGALLSYQDSLMADLNPLKLWSPRPGGEK